MRLLCHHSIKEYIKNTVRVFQSYVIWLDNIEKSIGLIIASMQTLSNHHI